MFNHMPRKPAPFSSGEYPLAPGTTCLIGRYEFPYSVPGPDGKLMSFDVLMALELPANKLLTTQIVDPSDSKALTAALRDIIRKPGSGKARRPERIRVATQRMADEVAAALGGGIAIEIASVAELDTVFAQMVAATSPEPELSYLSGDATPEQIGRLFEAMEDLFKAAPWELMTDSQVIRVDMPIINVREACMAIMGAAGASYGFLLFDSLESYESFGLSSDAAERGLPVELDVDFFSVSFDSLDAVPEELRREIRKHKWPVAGRNAYPLILSLAPGGKRKPVSAHDVRLAVGGLNAFLEVFRSNRTYFEEEASGQLLSATYRSNFEGEMTVIIPWASDAEIAEWESETVH